MSRHTRPRRRNRAERRKARKRLAPQRRINREMYAPWRDLMREVYDALRVSAFPSPVALRDHAGLCGPFVWGGNSCA